MKRIMTPEELRIIADDVKHDLPHTLDMEALVYTAQQYYAALEAKSQWRPISEAPKDGTWIFAWTPCEAEVQCDIIYWGGRVRGRRRILLAGYALQRATV